MAFLLVTNSRWSAQTNHGAVAGGDNADEVRWLERMLGAGCSTPFIVDWSSPTWTKSGRRTARWKVKTPSLSSVWEKGKPWIRGSVAERKSKGKEVFFGRAERLRDLIGIYWSTVFYLYP